MKIAAKKVDASEVRAPRKCVYWIVVRLAVYAKPCLMWRIPREGSKMFRNLSGSHTPEAPCS